MTKAITNNLNNLEDMLTKSVANSKQSKNYLTTSMDKSADFKKVFDKTVETKKSESNNPTETVSRSEKNIDNNRDNDSKGIEKNDNKQVFKDSKDSKDLETCDEKQTLGDVKKIFVKEDKSLLSGIRDVVEDAAKQSNIESSLDLTLARDINEIIAQLKDVVDSEEGSGQELLDETMLSVDTDELLADFELSEGEVDVEDLCAQLLVGTVAHNGQSVQNVQNGVNTEDIKALDEELTALLEKNLEQDSNIVEESTDLLLNSTDLADVVDTTIDFVSKDTTKVTDKDFVQELEQALDEEVFKDLNIESISAETENSQEDSLLQNQTPEEQALKAILNNDVEVFDIKIDKVVNQQNVQANQAKPVEVSPSKILEQISKQLEGLQNSSKVNIVLNPESLGKVNIQLLSTKEGLTAQFTVTTQEARDLLMKGLDGLKESLMSQGVGFDNVTVKVADAQESEYKQDWTEQEGSRGGNKGQQQSNREEKEKGLFEQMMAQTTVDEENGNV